MNKKTYIQPACEAMKMQTQQMLAASYTKVSTGGLGEDDDDLDYNEENSNPWNYAW